MAGAGAKALVTGFVQSRSDGRLTFGCYVYDVEQGRELGRMGFIVSKNDWRRAAHKCSGMAYKGVTGSPGMFDTRIAYVAEGGVGTGLTKRVAVMDSDGTNHTYVTAGDTIVLTPRLDAGGGQARLRQLRRRHPAGPRPRFREQQPAPAGSGPER